MFRSIIIRENLLQKTIPAVVSVLCKSDIVYTRPYATLNAVGQLLTALPVAYAKELHRVFAEVLEQHRLNGTGLVLFVTGLYRPDIRRHRL